MKMSKLFLSIAALCGCVLPLSAVEFDSAALAKNVYEPLFQNRTAMNQETVKTAAAYLDTVEPKTDAEKIVLIRYRVMAQDQTTGADRSLTGLKKYADEILAKVQFEKTLTGTQYVSIFSLWWRQNEPEFAKGVYDLIKSTPGAESFGDAGLWANAIGKYDEAYDLYYATAGWPDRAMHIAIYKLNDPVKALSAANLIVAKNYSVATVKTVIRMTVEKLCGNSAINAAEMKNFLQNVNRKYTARLAYDKPAWEPIIAQIRTILETY